MVAATMLALIGAMTIAVSRLKRIESRSVISEHRFRDLWEASPVALFRTRPDGEILDANPEMLRLLGFGDKASLFAHNIREFYADPADRREWREELEHAGTVRGWEVEMRSRDDSPLLIALHARTSIEEGTGLPFYQGSFVDVTEHKRLEGQFLQAQKMEAVGRWPAAWPTISTIC